MLLLTDRQIERIYEVTDALQLKRGAVIVPLPAAPSGVEMVMPDGNLLICAPHGPSFDPWFAGLPGRLASVDLSRTPRADQLEPTMLRCVPPEASGMRRWDWRVPAPHVSAPPRAEGEAVVVEAFEECVFTMDQQG